MAGQPRTRSGKVCGARNRRGLPCQCKLLLKGGKCKFHGGASTGPRTAKGRAAISEANRRRWAAWRAERESRPPTSAPAGQDEGRGRE